MRKYKLYTTENPECVEWRDSLTEAAQLYTEWVEYGHCPVCVQVYGDGSEVDVTWFGLSDIVCGRGDW